MYLLNNKSLKYTNIFNIIYFYNLTLDCDFTKEKDNLNSIITNRLELVLMTPELIEALLAGDNRLAESIGGFNIPDDIVLEKGLLEMRLKQIKDNPKVNIWLTRVIVIKKTNTMCGHIGFHSEPGPDDLRDIAIDGVEIGYSVGERFRKQGIAKEAALALMNWAFENYQQSCFILSISPNNVASLALANSMKFKEIGSHIDEEDGLELYFEHRL